MLKRLSRVKNSIKSKAIGFKQHISGKIIDYKKKPKLKELKRKLFLKGVGTVLIIFGSTVLVSTTAVYAKDLLIPKTSEILSDLSLALRPEFIEGLTPPRPLFLERSPRIYIENIGSSCAFYIRLGAWATGVACGWSFKIGRTLLIGYSLGFNL